MVHNLMQALLLSALIFWIFGLGVSFLFQRQQQYWNWSRNTLQRLFRDHWRYLLCVAIGYFLGTVGTTVHLSANP